MVEEAINTTPDTSSSAGNDRGRDPDLGVLLVHGIGHQKLGETIGWAGDPLFRWLKDWFECDPQRPNRPQAVDEDEDEYRVYLTSTSIVHPVSSEHGTPPAARLWFRQSKEASSNDRNWIVAESFWADEFAPPSFSELVSFGLGLAPILVERTGLQILGGVFRVLRSRLDEIAPGEGIFRRLLVPMQKFIVTVLSGLFSLLSGLLLLIISAIAQILILVLYLFGFFPPLQNLILQVQLHLAGWLGDAYLVAASPMRYSSMVSKVRRDLDWLLREHPDHGPCKAIAVIAHSGGAIIAHEALTGPQSECYRTLETSALLITYGSGHSKEYTIQKLLPKRGFFFAALQVTRVLLSTLLLGLLIFLMTPQPFLVLDQTTLLLLVVAALLVQALLLWAFRSRVDKLYTSKPFRPRKPTGLEWKDYLAIADVVTDKPIIPQAQEDTITTEVHNRHSLSEDHGGYWDNKGEFVPDVVRRLFSTAGWNDPAGDPQSQLTIDEAQRRHRSRVNTYFGAGLISLWTLPLLWFSMAPILDQLGSPLRDFVIGLLPDVTKHAGVVLTDRFWNTLIGGALVALAVFLWQQWIVRRLWNWWTRQEQAAMFKRNMIVPMHRPFTWLRALLFPLPFPPSKESKLAKDPSSEVKSAAAWFLLMSSLLPLLSILIAFLVGSVDRFDSGSYLLLGLSLALFVSRFTWSVIAWQALWKQPSEATVQGKRRQSSEATVQETKEKTYRL